MAKLAYPIELKRLGQKIRELRGSIDKTQEEFAELCDLHRTYIGQIERGEKNISFENIMRVCAALKIKPSELFDQSQI